MPTPHSLPSPAPSEPYPGRAAHKPQSGRRALLALLAAGGLLPAASGAATAGEVPIGGFLRDAPLQGLNGPSRHLSQFLGRQLLINVWASWCPPCLEEMASIERLAWMEGRPPFAMIGISTDDDPEPARAYLRRSNATISHFIDHALRIETMLGASRIPLTVLVGADGRILDKIHGARDWDARESLLLLERAFGRARTVAAR